MPPPPFTLDRPRYDPSTFLGRWKLYSQRMMYPQYVAQQFGHIEGCSSAKQRWPLRRLVWTTSEAALPRSVLTTQTCGTLAKMAMCPNGDNRHVKPWYVRTPVVPAAATALGTMAIRAGIQSNSIKTVALFVSGYVFASICRDINMDCYLLRLPSTKNFVVTDHDGVVRGASAAPREDLDRKRSFVSLASFCADMCTLVTLEHFKIARPGLRFGALALGAWGMMPLLCAVNPMADVVHVSDIHEPEFQGMRDSRDLAVNWFAYDFSIWTEHNWPQQ